MLKSLLVIAVGASLGAWLRWLLGMKLNALFPTIPPTITLSGEQRLDAGNTASGRPCRAVQFESDRLPVVP